MKRVKFNKKSIIIFIFILGIGTTLAYFTSTVTIPNIFNSARYETTTTEEFTSPSNWKPGDTTPKTVVTTNNSNLPIRVRISVEETWTDKNNNNLSLEENNTLAAILDLDNRPDWIYEDGYYYYRYDVAPGESTNSFIKSVTFNKDIVGEYVCVTENNNEQCDSASDTYQDANYKLNIKVETTQADNYMDAWGLEHAPRRVDPTYCTYEGNLEIGTEYVNGQYTYKYMQKKKIGTEWEDMEDVGWGVILSDKDSTDPVTTPLCTYINDIPVIATSYMFSNSKAISIDTSSFDTSEIKHMNRMFFHTDSAKIDVSNFETSNVENMDGMFYYANGEGLDVSSFDTSKVTNMGYLFGRMTNKPNIDISHFDTSNVTNMRYMFYYFDGKLKGAELLNTKNVTNMAGMFSNFKLNKIDISNYDTTNVENMASMFYSFSGEVIGLEDLYTKKVTNMSSMFSFSNISNFDISNFDTSKVTNMASMFSGSKYSSIDLRNFDTSNVTSMLLMFNNTSNLEEIIGIEDFDVSRVRNFGSMFYGPNKLTKLDLKKWNTQSATGGAFDRMFRDCGNLEYLDIRNFDTSAATTFESFLCNLGNLTYLNMSNLDSQNVTSFHYFVVNMHKIKEHDFSSLKTSKVKDMSYLFHWNYALEKLYISDLWDMSAVTSSAYMFAINNYLTGEINNRYTMKPRINNLAISDTSTRTIHVGESITIPTVTATYTDDSVVVKNSEDLIWKSSDLDIAKANLGIVKGMSPGEATITIKSGIVETTFNVVVVE